MTSLVSSRYHPFIHSTTSHTRVLARRVPDERTENGGGEGSARHDLTGVTGQTVDFSISNCFCFLFNCHIYILVVLLSSLNACMGGAQTFILV